MGYNILINHYQFLAIQLYRNTFVIFNILDVAVQFLRSIRTYKDTILVQHNIRGIHLQYINQEVAQVAYKIFHVSQRDKPLPIRIQLTNPSDKAALLKQKYLFYIWLLSLSGLHTPWRQASKLHRKIYVISQSFLMQILCSASGCILKLHQIFTSVFESIPSARAKWYVS